MIKPCGTMVCDLVINRGLHPLNGWLINDKTYLGFGLSELRSTNVGAHAILASLRVLVAELIVTRDLFLLYSNAELQTSRCPCDARC